MELEENLQIFSSICSTQDDKFFSKAVESVNVCVNQREICTTPSRILVHEDIADLFIERMQERLKLIKAETHLIQKQ
jgi:aldehyde dehydrogenase (NAD+)/aldehyde dehydrogenase